MHIRAHRFHTAGSRPARWLSGTLALVSGLALATLAVAPANAGTAAPATPSSTASTKTVGNTAVRFGAADLPGGNSFMLRNYATNGCADLPNYGSVPANTRVTQYTGCTTSESADNQDWHKLFTRRSPDGVQLFELVNDKNPSMCLDLPNYGPDPAGTAVSVYPCATASPGTDNQEWYEGEVSVNGVDLGTAIMNYMSTPGFPTQASPENAMCLDVSGWASNGTDRGNGKPLTIYNCFNSGWDTFGWDDHIWYPQNATS
jgi:hypothetical protein